MSGTENSSGGANWRKSLELASRLKKTLRCCGQQRAKGLIAGNFFWLFGWVISQGLSEHLSGLKSALNPDLTAHWWLVIGCGTGRKGNINKKKKQHENQVGKMICNRWAVSSLWNQSSW